MEMIYNLLSISSLLPTSPIIKVFTNVINNRHDIVNNSHDAECCKDNKVSDWILHLKVSIQMCCLTVQQRKEEEGKKKKITYAVLGRISNLVG